MKVIITTLALFTLSSNLMFAQEDAPKDDFNKWSLEVNIGQNKAEKPYKNGYFSTDPKSIVNFNNFHVDLGARYMFNPYFGTKFDLGYDVMQNQSGTTSLPFETKQYRFGAQGVINMGRLLNFEKFTNSFGVLFHGGLQVSLLDPQMINKNVSDVNGGIILGVTPQIKLSQRMVLNADFSMLTNYNQNLNWDGSGANNENNLTSSLMNTSLGLTWYLGKNEKHADWIVKDELSYADGDAREKIAAIEAQMQDTDKDGVPDYLDRQNNTPGGVKVDQLGRFIDENKNNIADDLEPRDNFPSGEKVSLKSVDAELLESGLVNLYFDLNSSVPNAGSTNNLFILVQYLQKNPQASVELYGYTDSTGSEALNQELSAKRAAAVADFLTSSGIAASRIAVKGLGKDQQFQANAGLNASLARRVAIKIIK